MRSPCQTSSHQGRWVRWGILSLMIVGLCGCAHFPVCKSSRLQTNERALRGMWNTLKHLKGKRMKEQWASRFLDQLLGGTPYQLKARGKAYVVVDPSDADRPCRVNVAPQQKQVRDAQFLTRLYTIKKRNNLKLRAYLYNAPKEYMVTNVKSSISGGDCRNTSYRVDFSYWKSISTKYSQATWPEACRLGHKLKKWDTCFPAGYLKIYRTRMKLICR